MNDDDNKNKNKIIDIIPNTLYKTNNNLNVVSVERKGDEMKIKNTKKVNKNNANNNRNNKNKNTSMNKNKDNDFDNGNANNLNFRNYKNINNINKKIKNNNNKNNNNNNNYYHGVGKCTSRIEERLTSSLVSEKGTSIEGTWTSEQ